jgi:hypothetical protein
MNGDAVAGTLAILAVSLLGACGRHRTVDVLACPLSEADYSRQIAAAQGWNALYSLYKSDSPRCPTASAQANYSRQLVLLLAHRWQDLPAFAQSAQRDPALAGFLYSHIDVHAEAANLKQLLENARSHCPTGASALCEQLAWRAQAALIAQGLST